MKNKYLVTVIVPEIEEEYEIYIPNNKKIGTIKKNILISINELSNGNYNHKEEEVRLFDRTTGFEYDIDLYIKDSGIKNGSKLIIM